MRIRALALLPVLALLAPAPAQASGPLSPEQQALLGCGPLWGTECPTAGVDLAAADAGVLVQSWVGYEGHFTTAYPQPGSVRFVNGQVPIPPARGPVMPQGLQPQPWSSGQVFTNEMGAISWNFLMLLVALSQGEAPDQFDPTNPYAHYDPNDPSTATDQGQCSFLQPQYCSSVQSLFDVVPPPAPPVEPAVEPPPWRGPAVGRSAKRAGCLPPARGLASLSAGRPAFEVGRRAGRCPKR